MASIARSGRLVYCVVLSLNTSDSSLEVNSLILLLSDMRQYRSVNTILWVPHLAIYAYQILEHVLIPLTIGWNLIIDLIYDRKWAYDATELKAAPHCYSVSIHRFFVSHMRVLQVSNPTILLIGCLNNAHLRLLKNQLNFQLLVDSNLEWKKVQLFLS